MELNINEIRAEELIRKYGFNFENVPREDLRLLLQKEIKNFTPGTSSYVRTLCGYLFCIGNIEDADLITSAKYDINFEIGRDIDDQWIDSLNGFQDEYAENREELINLFVDECKSYYKIND